MLTLFQHRQRALVEQIEGQFDLVEAVNLHLDLLKLKVHEVSRLPNELLLEHQCPNFAMELILEEDQQACNDIVHAIIEMKKAETAEFFEAVAAGYAPTGNAAIDQFRDKVVQQVKVFMGDLAQQVSKAMAGYSAPPADADDQTPPAAGPGGGAPAPSNGAPGGTPQPPAPTPDDDDVSMGGQPTAPATAGAAPQGAPAAAGNQKPGFWRTLFRHPIRSARNLYKNISRGARRAIHDDPSLEHIQNMLIERNVDIAGMVNQVGDQIIGFIDQNLPALAKGLASASPEGEAGGAQPQQPQQPSWTSKIKGVWPVIHVASVFRQLGQKLNDPNLSNLGPEDFSGIDPASKDRRLPTRTNQILQAIAKAEGIDNPAAVWQMFNVYPTHYGERGRLLRLAQEVEKKYQISPEKRHVAPRNAPPEAGAPGPTNAPPEAGPAPETSAEAPPLSPAAGGPTKPAPPPPVAPPPPLSPATGGPTKPAPPPPEVTAKPEPTDTPPKRPGGAYKGDMAPRDAATSAPAPASAADDTAIDQKIMDRIKDRSRAARDEGGDPSDAALLDILQGRKPDPEKGIKAIPRLHSPTSRWHTNIVRKAVKSRIESGMPLDQAVDSMLDAFKQTGGFKTEAFEEKVSRLRKIILS